MYTGDSNEKDRVHHIPHKRKHQSDSIPDRRGKEMEHFPAVGRNNQRMASGKASGISAERASPCSSRAPIAILAVRVLTL